MNDKGNLTDKRPPLLPTIIGTGLGSGFWPWGPGTAGSVLGTLIWAVIALFAGLAADRSIHHIGHMGHRTTPALLGRRSKPRGYR